MDLTIGTLITRNIVHEIPVTDVVIKAVKTMAYKQGFKSLKFKNRHGVIFYSADWIAGVDYDDDDDDDDDENEEDQVHHRSCFTPISVATMTSQERRKVQQALMFLGEKHDGAAKRRMVGNGKPTREWLSREDSLSYSSTGKHHAYRSD
jgi:hypothetical protein